MSDRLQPQTELTKTQAGRRTLLRALGAGGLYLATANTGDVLAQCIGPDVPCPTPDGIARFAVAELYRTVRHNDELYAISDAALRGYLLKPIGTSMYPELDRQNPRLGADGLPVAFLDTKSNRWRDVEKQVLFKAVEPDDPRFNGRLIDVETGKDRLEIYRGGDEIKDRVDGKVRDVEGCGPNVCGLNCAEVIVFERQMSGKNPRPFLNSLGKYERFQAALWLWELDEKNPSIHALVSYTNQTAQQIAGLVASGQAKKGLQPKFADLTYQLQAK